jgi:hypothetical protein
MRYRRCGLIVAVLLFAGLELAQAQSPRPLQAALPVRFESWRPPVSFHSNDEPVLGRLVTTTASQNRTRQALLGGAIGAGAGVVLCTVVSTLANDSAEGGVSFCPLDSYLLIGGAGFVLGATIAWAI